MKFQKKLGERKTRRARRVRAKIFGTALRPRLAVFRSNRGMYVQLINDETGKTICAMSTKELGKEMAKKPKSEQAVQIGEAIAKKAKEKGITKAVFDRRSYAYHGRVKALADGARKGGLVI